MAVRSAPPRSPRVPEIRKGDTVVVLAGKDAGKRGTVERVIVARPPRARSRACSVAARPPVARSWSSRVSTSPSGTRSRASRPVRATVSRRCSRAAIMDMPSRSPSVGSCSSAPDCGKPTRVAHATAGDRPCGPGLPSLRRADRGEGVRSRLAERYTTEVVPALEAVRVREPDAGPAPVQDRRQHRPRRGAREREGARRRHRRPDLITGQKPIVTKAKQSIAQFRVRTGNSSGPR